MKCFIDKHGYLNISAENDTELYALEKWMEEGSKEGRSPGFKVNPEVVHTVDKWASDYRKRFTDALNEQYKWMFGPDEYNRFMRELGYEVEDDKI